MSASLARIFCLIVLMSSPLAVAQTRVPLEFPELRGTWVLDESVTAGLRVNRGTAGGLIDGLGFPAPRTLVIATTPTGMSLTRNSAPPEIYRFDGRDRQVRDERTGVLLDRSHRFTLVAGMPALTTTEASDGGEGTRGIATILTDAYRVDGDVLTIERQHSVLDRPEGSLLTLANPNRRQTLVYRRTGR